jgi:hypothetical protein
MRSGDFKEFDYGDTLNMAVYGQPEPKAYELETLKERFA